MGEAEVEAEEISSMEMNLILELKLLSRLIYKNKNQHRHSKYFQSLIQFHRQLQQLLQLSPFGQLAASIRAIRATNSAGGSARVQTTSESTRTHQDVAVLTACSSWIMCVNQQILPQLISTARKLFGLVSQGFFLPLAITLVSILACLRNLLLQMALLIVDEYNAQTKSIGKRLILTERKPPLPIAFETKKLGPHILIAPVWSLSTENETSDKDCDSVGPVASPTDDHVALPVYNDDRHGGTSTEPGLNGSEETAVVNHSGGKDAPVEASLLLLAPALGGINKGDNVMGSDILPAEIDARSGKTCAGAGEDSALKHDDIITREPMACTLEEDGREPATCSHVPGNDDVLLCEEPTEQHLDRQRTSLGGKRKKRDAPSPPEQALSKPSIAQLKNAMLDLGFEDFL